MGEMRKSQRTQVPSDIEEDLAARVTVIGEGLQEIMGLLAKMPIQEKKPIRISTVPACNAEG